MKLLEKSKVVAIVFYVIAALFLIYTIFTIITTIQYLASVVDSGMYVTITASDMISAFVGQVGPYLFYTVVTFACGYVIQILGESLEIVPEAAEKVSAPQAVESTESYDDKANEDAIEAELAESILENDPDTVILETELVPDDQTEVIKKTEEQIAQAIDSALSEQETEKIELENEEDK